MSNLAFVLVIAAVPLGTVAALPTAANAQHAGHGSNTAVITEGGQAAFAALAEIVAILLTDPATDWSRVDIEALRRHLIDMDRVTMNSQVVQTDIPDGAAFDVSGADADTVTSIHRMTQAHGATIDRAAGWNLSTEASATGAIVRVTGPDEASIAMIRGLSFSGILTLGMHHPTHHLAIGRGDAPHGH